jgi:hypothetical protein
VAANSIMPAMVNTTVSGVVVALSSAAASSKTRVMAAVSGVVVEAQKALWRQRAKLCQA